MERVRGWVTKRDAAAYLSISIRTLERLAARGWLRVHRVGKGIARLSWDDVAKFKARAEAGGFADVA